MKEEATYKIQPEILVFTKVPELPHDYRFQNLSAAYVCPSPRTEKIAAKLTVK